MTNGKRLESSRPSISAQAKTFKAVLDKPSENSDPEYVRWVAGMALRQSVDFAEQALAIRWHIVTHAESLAGSLGEECPRSLRRFYTLLRPHGYEDEALKIWPEVQVDLDSIYAAKGVVVQPFTNVATGKALHTSPAEPPKPVEGDEGTHIANAESHAAMQRLEKAVKDKRPNRPR